MKKLLVAIAALLFVAVLVFLCSKSKKESSAEAVVPAEELKDLFRGEVDTFKTDSGIEIDLFSIKHASVAMRAGDRWIYIDPVNAGAKPEVDYSAMPKADYIFITHNHLDHCDTTAIAALTKEGTQVFADPTSVGMIGFGKAMGNGDAVEISNGWTVEAVPAYNSPEKQQFHPQGRDNGYIFTIDGFRVYFAGDLELIPELENVKDIDVAFLPCNLPFTMTPEQCAEAAKIVRPLTLFPYHFSQTDLTELVDLLDNTGIDVRLRLYQ